jgi:hypothetical protein
MLQKLLHKEIQTKTFAEKGASILVGGGYGRE